MSEQTAENGASAGIPAHALTSPNAYLDWVMYQSWPVLEFLPVLCACPLCAAMVLNEWGARRAHAVWHGHGVFPPVVTDREAGK